MALLLLCLIPGYVPPIVPKQFLGMFSAIWVLKWPLKQTQGIQFLKHGRGRGEHAPDGVCLPLQHSCSTLKFRPCCEQIQDGFVCHCSTGFSLNEINLLYGNKLYITLSL